MAYQALYRKYRPKTFEDVVGQEHITKTLQNQIKSGQISHAYLFTGTRGTGKTSVAKIFAKAINCQTASGSPCETCEVCKGLSNPNNLDILEIDAASNNRVDEIRDLRENVKFMPTVGKYKVYIIDEVHMLTDSAFNALLKTLEEPPEHVVFILATTEVHKLPATILSRCIRFDFKLIPVGVLANHLKSVFAKEDITCSEDALKEIALKAEGSCRDMLSIADCISAYSGKHIEFEDVEKVLGVSDKQTIIALADAIISKNIGDCLEIINKLSETGKNIIAFAKDLTVHFRDLLVVKSCKEPNSILGLPTTVYESYKEQADKAESKTLIEYVKVFSSIEAELKLTLSPRTLLETAVLIAISGDEDLKKN